MPRRFYQRDTVTVARELVGKLLVRRLPAGTVVVRLVDVEAYLGVGDPACHTFGGRRTRRTEVMWGEAGRLYVYFVYGMHHCANVVTRKAGVPEAVLLRGAVPVAGGAEGVLLGPARLTRALAIDGTLNGADLTTGAEVFLADDGWALPPQAVQALPRVGVQYAGEAAAWPLRFAVVGQRGARPPRASSPCGVAAGARGARPGRRGGGRRTRNGRPRRGA